MEEKIRIVVEGMKRDVSVAELCRQEGIPSAAPFQQKWRGHFLALWLGRRPSRTQDAVGEAEHAV